MCLSKALIYDCVILQPQKLSIATSPVEHSFGETLIDFPAPGLLIFGEEYTVLTAFGARAVFLCPRDEQLDPARMEG